MTQGADAYESTKITLERPPYKITAGDMITFSGKLTTASGKAISGETIYIKDDDKWGLDDLIATTGTGSNGKFSVTVVAKDWDKWSEATEIYAEFNGNNNYQKSRSGTYEMYVEEANPSAVKQFTALASDSQKYLPTNIYLNKIPSSVYTDQTVTFTGKLTSNGSPLAYHYVKIMEDDPFKPDQLIVNGRTDSNGQFSIVWDVTGGYVETDFDVYASFDNDGTYAYSRTSNQQINVLRYGGSISLDPLPSSVDVGNLVTFSGTLKLNKGSSEGAVVYIKDEDPFGPDDLIATAFADYNGKYSVDWIVNQVDSDKIADIYAVFEGDDILYRQTTCDIGPTMPIGGRCANTIPMRIYGTVPPLPPPDQTVGGKEYMELYYSLNFPTTPRVVIVPSPDSYSEVRSHIIPTQEGILIWKSKMEQKFGGDWNVNFEVISPGKLFVGKTPDVVVNLVTPEDEANCSKSWFGWALISKNPKKPIQTYICSSLAGYRQSDTDVASTAAHEFIHAVGLGHAFYKNGDLMCSTEDGNPTCPGSNTWSNSPSDLNLKATATLYGGDGFKNPNNNVPYGTKYYGEDYRPSTNTQVNPNQVNPNQVNPNQVNPNQINPNIITTDNTSTFWTLYSPSEIIKGKTAKFTGQLFYQYVDGVKGPVNDVTIYLKDLSTGVTNPSAIPTLKIATTDISGNFEIYWYVDTSPGSNVGNNNEWPLALYFEGNKYHKESVMTVQPIYKKSTAPPKTFTPDYGHSQTTKVNTKESLSIFGYDTRDSNLLYTHNGNQMNTPNSGGVIDGSKSKSERIAIHVSNDSRETISIKEVQFGGAIYQFDNKKPGTWDDSEFTPGEYEILTSSAMGKDTMWLRMPAVLSGSTATILLDLQDDYEIGADVQFKITSTNDNIFLGTVTIGKRMW